MNIHFAVTIPSYCWNTQRYILNWAFIQCDAEGKARQGSETRWYVSTWDKFERQTDSFSIFSFSFLFSIRSALVQIAFFLFVFVAAFCCYCYCCYCCYCYCCGGCCCCCWLVLLISMRVKCENIKTKVKNTHCMYININLSLMIGSLHDSASFILELCSCFSFVINNIFVWIQVTPLFYIEHIWCPKNYSMFLTHWFFIFFLSLLQLLPPFMSYLSLPYIHTEIHWANIEKYNHFYIHILKICCVMLYTIYTTKTENKRTLKLQVNLLNFVKFKFSFNAIRSTYITRDERSIGFSIELFIFNWMKLNNKYCGPYNMIICEFYVISAC